MSNKTTDSEVLASVLEPWKAAIDANDPESVAEVFTDEAIFQGLHPYSVGRQGVIEYYASQPTGIAVEYQVLQSRRLGDDAVLGYVSADFSFPERPAVTVFLTVVAVREGLRWLIAHYQAALLP